MTERIYMDDFHYESYDNFKEAIDAWSIQTTHAQIAIDSELDLNLGMEGISDIIMFDEVKFKEIIGNESIKDTVKNMASRVKSNLTLWIKKFVNFFFGWIINFFRGVVNIRKSLKSGYDKSKAYLKKMNEMTSKLGNDFTNKEGEQKMVKISNAEPGLIQSLCVVLAASYSISRMVVSLSSVNQSIDSVQAKETNKETGKPEIKESFVVDNLKRLSAAVIAMGAFSAAIDPTDKEFYNSFKAQGYSIEKWCGNTNDIEQRVRKVLKEESVWETVKNAISNFIKGTGLGKTSTGNTKADTLAENVKKASDRIKQVLGESIKHIENPEPQEMEYAKAFSVVKAGLEAFNNIAVANKNLWNFEKAVEQVEKIKRRLNAAVDKYVNQDEESGKNLLNLVIATGQLMSTVSTNANKCMKNANKLLDTVITDATRLGAAMTSASDKN